MRGDYIFNENHVCMNPEVIIDESYLKLTIAKAGKYWITGCSIYLEKCGVGCGCSINNWDKSTDRNEQLTKEITVHLRWLERNKEGSKLYPKAKALLEKFLPGNPETEKKEEIGQLSLF